ncbi:methylamine utilization protein MauG [Pseudooceanicola nanhaiensis]|jgi:cytochrome c peroxidase|uniref:Methylamine utilization protein MauG n=1 Tax=Pseudooceanicola nanhaiensis TaxID=375761 RepID=A0A917SXT9_9RHOB|nr:cytochrome c peroxidase [Pseudooceanicola nanhaiensis]GGM02930.1 methylamine utilization protein MauG [Pseudooceanicola nanhaiensis]
MRWTLLFLLGAGAAAAGDLGPRPVFPEVGMAEVELGRLLFYDPVISGNRNISCGTCHHPTLGTSDGMSLSVGEGGVGLGPDRVLDPRDLPEERLPRNAPGLWNLGATEFTVMFHDGRLEEAADQPDGIRTPLGADMIRGFDTVLSAQAMFPVLSGDEMAGHYSENDVSQSVRLSNLTGDTGAWVRIADRVAEIPEYREMFDAVLGAGAPIRFTDIANVIADFITFEWRADESPFDTAMAGGPPLSEGAERGRMLFYGEAGCSACHAGWFQTDHGFHAIAMPQLGPGKAARFEAHSRDEGRIRVTGDPADAYRFRTPSLRNVTLTAPYGHDGAYATLEGVVRHHLDPVASLRAYDRSQVVLHELPGAEDWTIMDAPDEVARIADANELEPLALSDGQVDDILAFLAALTDREAAEGRLGVPDTVPSGLPVDR